MQIIPNFKESEQQAKELFARGGYVKLYESDKTSSLPLNVMKKLYYQRREIFDLLMSNLTIKGKLSRDNNNPNLQNHCLTYNTRINVTRFCLPDDEYQSIKSESERRKWSDGEDALQYNGIKYHYYLSYEAHDKQGSSDLRINDFAVTLYSITSNECFIAFEEQSDPNNRYKMTLWAKPVQLAFFKLGKDAKELCANIDKMSAGIINTHTIVTLSSGQFKKDWYVGNYVFIWLGSDNSNGTPTSWKQGIKAIARTIKLNLDGQSIITSVDVELLYIFPEAIGIIDILRMAPESYYWCSSLPFINPNDHANQSPRLVRNEPLCNPEAFFDVLRKIDANFEKAIISLEPKFEPYFDYIPECPNPVKINKNNEKKVNMPYYASIKSPRQLIYFGAPGTSKSTTIKEKTEDKKKEVHRITFHPDTDYSNFVGCYKPTKLIENEHELLGYDELVKILKEYRNLYDETHAQIMFAMDYCKSLVRIENRSQLLRDAGGSTYDTYLKIGIKLADNNNSSKITYEFVAQTFTKAYISAWKKLSDSNIQDKEVFLVIEEINRGNCAQIFGDLFQLLDRNKDGYSDYAIEPDTDLQNYLAKEFEGIDVPENIKSGKNMLLPPNLYIWATMNTSDQSLFPIDSAFKRRWDWKYLPITDAGKGHKVSLKIDGKKLDYDWWKFLEAVNERIESLTESEDKQLGYWFARPREGKEIDAETFVGKVVFYLWNDIFKDFGEDDRSPFMVFKVDDAEHKGSKEKITFRKFFDAKGDVKPEMVKRFLDSLGLIGEEVVSSDEPEPSNPDDSKTNQPEEPQINDEDTIDSEESTSEENLSDTMLASEESSAPTGPRVSSPNVGNIPPMSSEATEPTETDEELF